MPNILISDQDQAKFVNAINDYNEYKKSQDDKEWKEKALVSSGPQNGIWEYIGIREEEISFIEKRGIEYDIARKNIAYPE